MPVSHLFREQHETIRSQIEALRATLDPGALSADGAAARHALDTVSASVRVHLASEDNSLYPSLASSADEALRATSQAFRAEMGGLAAAYKAYTDRWPTPSRIEQYADQFVRESVGVLAALGDRMAREERDLYPLLDAG